MSNYSAIIASIIGTSQIDNLNIPNAITANSVSAPTISETGAFTTTATAAGTTTLTANSTRIQIFTGTTTQTITLPAVSTLFTGKEYLIINDSTGNLTINSSGANLVTALLPNSKVRLVANTNTGTGASVWESLVYPYSDSTGYITKTMLPSGTIVNSWSAIFQGTQTINTITNTGTSGAALSNAGGGVQISSLSITGITPISSNSKFFLISHASHGGAASGIQPNFWFVRYATSDTTYRKIGAGTSSGNRPGVGTRSWAIGNDNIMMNACITYIDSPAVSSGTINYYVCCGGESTVNVTINMQNGDSSSNVLFATRGASTLYILEIL